MRGVDYSASLLGGGAVEVIPEGWHTVDFIVEELMASNLAERPSTGGGGQVRHLF